MVGSQRKSIISVLGRVVIEHGSWPTSLDMVYLLCGSEAEQRTTLLNGSFRELLGGLFIIITNICKIEIALIVSLA